MRAIEYTGNRGRASKEGIDLRLQAEDTDLRAERKHIELLRAATVARRTALAFSMSEMVIRLARRALQNANPQLTLREALVRFVALHYGPELAERLDRDPQRRSV